MIHAICDFCGKDCDRTANLLTLQPFQNFARYDTDNEPYGYAGPKRSFTICHDCMVKHALPNPYHSYDKLNAQKMHYEKTLDNYNDADMADDARTERERRDMLRGTDKKRGQDDGKQD